MPRQLFTLEKWHFILIDSDQLRCGDILFAKNKKRRKLLGHAAVALNNQEILHCNAEMGTARIQKIKDFFNNYEQRLTAIQSLRYIDPRDQASRKKHNGLFIKV